VSLLPCLTDSVVRDHREPFPGVHCNQ